MALIETSKLLFFVILNSEFSFTGTYSYASKTNEPKEFCMCWEMYKKMQIVVTTIICIMDSWGLEKRKTFKFYSFSVSWYCLRRCLCVNYLRTQFVYVLL